MKRIIKQELEEFQQWKSSQPLPPGWAEFDGKPIKQKVKAALLKEQGMICCFCEDRVTLDQGHIAHLHDQQGHPELVLEYDNLLYSCAETPKKKPNTCGHAQGTKVLPITPLDEDCELRFIYTGTGSMIPGNEEDVDAAETIRLLNLDDKRAIWYEKRRMAFQTVKEQLSIVSKTVFENWITRQLSRKSDGTFEPFWTVIKYAAG